MHDKVKKRIAEKKETKDTRPVLKLPASGNLYNNFIGGIDRLSEELLKSPKIMAQEKTKIAKLKAKIKIDL